MNVADQVITKIFLPKNNFEQHITYVLCESSHCRLRSAAKSSDDGEGFVGLNIAIGSNMFYLLFIRDYQIESIMIFRTDAQLIITWISPFYRSKWSPDREENFSTETALIAEQLFTKKALGSSIVIEQKIFK